MPDSVDTSSYPKPVQSNFLDTAQKFQGLEQGSITLQQSKLKQMNDQFNIMNSELATLANNPNVTKEMAQSRLLTLAKTFNLKPEITQHMLGELNSAPDVKSFAQNALVRGMATQEKVNNLYGTPQVIGNGQQNYPTAVSPITGVRQIGTPWQVQTPPGQEVVDTNPTLSDGSPNPYYGQKRLYGPNLPVAPPGVATGPGQSINQSPRVATSPGQAAALIQPKPVRTLPISSDKNINLTGPGKTITGVDVQDVPPPNSQAANRFPAPSGPAVGYSPLFEEGKKAYSEDQSLATQKLTAVKPAIAAANLMKDLRSGPGTETWNKAVAFMKANNIIPTTANDPTAIYQEVNKYLNQYVQGGGTRSDADLAQRELSNPNVTQQISPALIKLTRNTIALDRIQAARAGSFESGDFSQYGKYRSNFPASVDERAFSIDLLEPAERQKLLGDMLKKKDTKEGQKFFKSLEIAKRTGVLQ